jgi:hypothetical protein
MDNVVTFRIGAAFILFCLAGRKTTTTTTNNNNKLLSLANTFTGGLFLGTGFGE